nr:pleckstrin homology-like domain family B member 1 [Maniola hyperantus]
MPEIDARFLWLRIRDYTPESASKGLRTPADLHLGAGAEGNRLNDFDQGFFMKFSNKVVSIICRVATNTPHLVSLGTGRLSTAVTLHPIKQGRVTIGSDPTCDIYVVGTGVANVHCRVENSHGVVTLYPTSGTTLLDGLPVDKPTRLSQGSMLTIGRSNYLRFNHPEEAKLMKSVLPSGHVSMAPIQFQPNEQCVPTGKYAPTTSASTTPRKPS